MVEPWLRKPAISVRLRYVSTKTDNAFCSAVEQAVGKPLVAGSNPVCANRKSIIRVEMSKVSFIFGDACYQGGELDLQSGCGGFDSHRFHENYMK